MVNLSCKGKRCLETENEIQEIAKTIQTNLKPAFSWLSELLNYPRVILQIAVGAITSLFCLFGVIQVIRCYTLIKRKRGAEPAEIELEERENQN